MTGERADILLQQAACLETTRRLRIRAQKACVQARSLRDRYRGLCDRYRLFRLTRLCGASDADDTDRAGSVPPGITRRDVGMTRGDLSQELRELRQRLIDAEAASSPERRLVAASAAGPRARAIVEDQRLISRWRPDGALSFVNDAYCRYFGKTREELIGVSWLPLVLDADREPSPSRADRPCP